MDRSVWLSLLLVVLAVAVVLTGRAALESTKSLESMQQMAEIQALDGAAPSADLSARVTRTAGCIVGFRPPVRSCWYVWANPSQPAYLETVAAKVNSQSTTSAAAWGGATLLAWLLVAIAAWKASRRRQPYRPDQPAPISRSVATHPPGGRLTP